MEWGISTTQLAVLIPLVIVSVDIIRRRIEDRALREAHTLPPGPTPLPLVGSALSVNFGEPFRTYTEWRAKYGDIMYIRLLGTDVVVLNSPSVAMDLLDKRSQIYSDRPFISTVDLYGHDSTFAFTRYGEHWRLCRRIFHQTFRADAAVNFRPMQLRTARQLILSLLDNPEDYTIHYSTFAASVTMRSVYDYDPSPQNDPMVLIMNKFIEASVSALSAERALLIKTFPFLLHIPEWIPGSWIRREARVSREWGVRSVEVPYQYVQEQMNSKEAINPSMVSDHISRMEQFDGSYRSVYEKALKHASSTAFLGSVETTNSTLMAFTLAMVKNPRVWKRAQADLDAIVGTERLPELEDRSSLPYIDAVLRETLRWQPPVPLGVPHATIDDDIYNGYYIPKGTYIGQVHKVSADSFNATGATVFANVWAMSRDETRYPDPEKFIPERFLDAQGMLTDDKPDFVFGFGRRICPGRHAADTSVWVAMVTMLAALEFGPARDAEGNDIAFEAEYVCGVARHPLTFPCCITPRPHISKICLEQVLAK